MPAFGIMIALLLVALNGFFVGAEFAVIKVRSTQLEALVRSGSRPARILQRIHQHLDSYLSATQLGVTLASLALGWVGEPAIASLLEPQFARLTPGLSRPLSHAVGVVISFTIITYLHIVFGELAPKWLAIQKPERLALFIAGPLHLFYRVFYPVIWGLNATARILLGKLGIHPAQEGESALSEEELRIALSQSEDGGEINESAGAIADRAFHFGHGRVRDVMTPRPDIEFLNALGSMEHNLEIVTRSQYARFPFCQGDLDRVIGRVHVRDILPVALSPNAFDAHDSEALRSAVQPVLYVPENKPLDEMLSEFRAQRMEMAIVQDEYGMTAGVLTLEDILEELVGEIQQEFVPAPSEVEPLPDGSYLVDARITLARLVREHEVGEEVEGVETIGGFVLSTHTGHPRVGYSTPLGSWSAEVAELTGRRIRRVRLTRTGPPAAPNE